MYELLILNLILPFVMTLVGYILKKRPATNMNAAYGYNTPTAQKSQEHWNYAQSIAPDIFIGFGKISGIVEFVLGIFSIILNIPIHSATFIGIVIGFIFLFFGFYKTDTNIKRKFANNKS